MKNIQIISSSVRINRKSIRVARYFQKLLESKYQIKSNILDLYDYQFPIFNERLKFQNNPDKKVIEFAEAIKQADGIIVVVPEYNGGYPSSLKNIIDLLSSEWHHKPIAISTVSSGSFGGSQVLTSIQFLFWKLKAITVTAMFPVPNVSTLFDESGVATDQEEVNKRGQKFIDELLWYVQANEKMK